MTRHGLDPFKRGAYTTVKLGVRRANFTAMTEPLIYGGQKMVFFAGEHTCGDYMGYLHGAYYSGLRAAHHVLEKMGLFFSRFYLKWFCTCVLLVYSLAETIVASMLQCIYSRLTLHHCNTTATPL
jgi:hypothetical protein